MRERPNFILFITDQHRANYLGCYGHPVLETPNIDAIAERGVCFDRFFVASPVCMPNRASLMTCRMPSSHGVRSNGIPLSRMNVTFVELLRDAGYDTALIGKSHLQNFTGNPPMLKRPEARAGYYKSGEPLASAVRDDFTEPAYQTESPTYWQSPAAHVPTPFYGFDHVELVTGHGDDVGGDYAAWLLAREPEAAKLIGRKNQLPHEYTCPQAVRTAVPAELYSTTYIAERAAAWLDGRKDDSKPFFLMVSWPDPHHPFNPPGKYWDMYRPDDMDLPAAFARNDWTPPFHVAAAISDRERGKAAINGMGTIACSAQEALEARALTCGMIAMVDDAVGQVVSSLDASGHRQETVVVFTSDHGDHLGDHRLLFKGTEQYEQITRVPFIWSDPASPTAGRSGDVAQTIDIGTTILERARIEPAFGMQGQALTVVDGTARTAAYIEYDHQKNDAAFGPEPRVHTIRDSRWRLSVYNGSEFGELYDLETDPDELDNLWDQPSAATEKARLIEQLARLQMASVNRVPGPTAQA